ncbi:MAG TPA: heme exporter protein CcmD [Pyrinomonadaceae bacterium]|jgi:heme exporter protein D
MDWSMGGYGFYVWGSYFFAALAIGLELFSLSRRKRSCAQNVNKDDRGQITEAKSSYVAQA